MENSFKCWITEQESEALNKFSDSWFKSLMMYNREDIEKRRSRTKNNEDNRKLAKIMIGRTEFTAWVDTVTGNAYKCGGWYEKTWMRIPRFSFKRWCSLMDM